MRCGQVLRACGAVAVGWFAVLSPGCTQRLIDSTDRQVQNLIRQRQVVTLGEASHADLAPEDGRIGPTARMYDTTPRPVGPELPPGFAANVQSPSDAPTEDANDTEPMPVAPGAEVRGGASNGPQQVAERAEGDLEGEPEQASLERFPFSRTGSTGSDTAPDPSQSRGPKPGARNADTGIASVDDDDEDSMISPDIFTPDQLDWVRLFKLSDALAYAAKHARSLQDAKEDLYLAALDLTLERHLWTPQWVASLRGEFADYGQVRDFDRAMTAVSNVSLTQRLPYGGEVSARIINRLMRDLGEHITSGETGDLIIEANIPLFRGAGRVAYESRYQAERSLIYAVRTFERFRRSFLVNIAGDYFNLQRIKAGLLNANTSYLNTRESWERAELMHETGRERNVDDAPRARSSFRNAEAAVVSAKESYETALDRFKIRIGMEVDALLDVIDQADDVESEALEALLPTADEQVAVAVALKYRLDLLTSADQVDDARRGVVITKNRILPDLDLTGSVSMASNPNELNSASFHTDRTTWRGMVELRMDDRKAERNDYRASLVLLGREERAHEQFIDTVRADVRRGMRRILRQSDIREIQEMNVAENVFRHGAATSRYNLGKSTNQDLVDADEDLLRARNNLAGAVADYRLAILEFRRDTGSLRINTEGSWIARGNTSADGP